MKHSGTTHTHTHNHTRRRMRACSISRCASGTCLLVVFAAKTLFPGFSCRWRKKSSIMQVRELIMVPMPSSVNTERIARRGTCRCTRDGVAC